MDRIELLNSVCKWFDEHKIKWYHQPADIPGQGNVVLPFEVKVITGKPRPKIAIVVCDAEKEGLNFDILREKGFIPFFIRDNDDEAFTLQKIRNCTRGWNTAKVRKEERLAKEREERKAKLEAEKKAKEEAEAAKAALKPKRKRIHFVKISRA